MPRNILIRSVRHTISGLALVSDRSDCDHQGIVSSEVRLSQIKEFRPDVREARKLVCSVYEKASHIVARSTKLIEESHRRIAECRKLIIEADALLKSRPEAGKS